MNDIFNILMLGIGAVVFCYTCAVFGWFVGYRSMMEQAVNDGKAEYYLEGKKRRWRWKKGL